MKPRIFVYRPHKKQEATVAKAYAEDGRVLYSAKSHWLSWFRNDTGLFGDGGPGRGGEAHTAYATAFPEGYDLVEVIGVNDLQVLFDLDVIKRVA